jgi:hypothetical protein
MPRRSESNNMEGDGGVNYVVRFNKVRDRILSILNSSLFKCAAIYITWITLHYASVHLYAKFCTASTIYGFILSPFIVDAPHCSALRWIIFHGASQINLMWTGLGAYLINCLEKFWQ